MKLKPGLLLAVTREEWRSWLARNHNSQQEIWLVYHKKHTGQPSIPYDDAVEEALCFGWIDSIVRRLDNDRYIQKFTPRRPDSQWSDLNRRRFDRLVREGKMTEAGLARAPGPAVAKAPKPSLKGYDSVPAYIAARLEKNDRAWRNFQSMAPSERRRYIFWIDSAKREETRSRRLAEAVTLLSKNEKLGLK
jgi:uncharacterized protein YdeI (YjbR/CyaY-like superfamily)